MLLEYTKDKSPKVIHSALYALYRTFSPLLSKGELQKPKNENPENDKKGLIKIWLRDNYVQYVNTLCNFLRHEEPGLQIPSLNILLNLLKIESTYLTSSSGTYQFSNNHFYHVVEGLIDNENFSEPLKNEFIEKYWNTYDDLRFYFLKDATKIINFVLESGRDKTGPIFKKKRLDGRSDNKLNSLMENTFSILEHLRTMPTDASEIDEFWTGHPAPELLENGQENNDCEDDFDNMSFDDIGFNEDFEKKQTKEPQKESPHNQTKKPILLQLSAHKRVFSNCWLALMKLPMTQESYKKILLIMHKKIIPYMPQPTLLMDYLTESYNAGGVISILALNGLFTLINEYNLDYPDFYKKLYTLFDRNLMHVKYRSRFFRLADLFLASTHLPVQLVAAFIKRMSRLSLTAPPHGIVMIIPMIYNLIRRHPSCTVLIHRPSEHVYKLESNQIDVSADPYNFDEPDPMKSNAFESSLWEMKTLQDHYFPNVATLAKIFQDKFTKPSYNLEDFLDHTYLTLIEAELNRKSKKNKTPALSYERPKYIFPTEESIELVRHKTKLEEFGDNEKELIFENMKKGWEIWQF
ncbi:CBF/Mak21 family-domain-containing protein [Glomus cerebriforme]|uniref:CBF/Mak21 family-domain-containing protein n=1 Tax=Glomus cerebriforme TaxID=658196 RepID=A0A397TF28_9GLOM|nr:CBF/Mak21 family-domain-containing protein [Glomus cerebriforme]